MTDSAIAVPSPWYRTLTREQWRVLLASNLGWLFDGFEIYALFLTVGFALHQLVEASQYAQIPRYAGYVLATTVFGWATGGVIGGIVADYIGRKRTMMLAVLAYTLTTGLSAIAWSWQSFAILRFLVGVGIGSEWAKVPRANRVFALLRAPAREGKYPVANSSALSPIVVNANTRSEARNNRVAW